MNKRSSEDIGAAGEKSDGARYSERGKAAYMGTAPGLIRSQRGDVDGAN